MPLPDLSRTEVVRLSPAPSNAAALSARFGRASQKRVEQIEGILETLLGLGR
jgi:hypothetical protein